MARPESARRGVQYLWVDSAENQEKFKEEYEKARSPSAKPRTPESQPRS
jgi:hypothetical protein